MENASGNPSFWRREARVNASCRDEPAWTTTLWNRTPDETETL